LPDSIGAYVDNGGAIKDAVSVPVITVGRMLPDVAEKAIADGRTDYAAMGRQLLADPDLPDKLHAGTPERVRPCINCYPGVAENAPADGRTAHAAMGRQLLADPDLPDKLHAGTPERVRPCINCYLCVAENFFDATPFCAVNPALGNEDLLPLTPAPQRKHVVVVGAGPSGLEAARVLTERGHRVTVLDKADRLGGTMWFSSLTTPDNEPLIHWFRSEADRLGIDVRLGTTASVESIRALRPDRVVVATGAERPAPRIPGGDLPLVQTGDTLRNLMLGTASADEVGFFLRLIGRLGRLSGITKSPSLIRRLTKIALPMGKDVVVIGGSLVGVELAEFLAERGRRVTLLH